MLREMIESRLRDEDRRTAAERDLAAAALRLVERGDEEAAVALEQSLDRLPSGVGVQAVSVGHTMVQTGLLLHHHARRDLAERCALQGYGLLRGSDVSNHWIALIALRELDQARLGSDPSVAARSPLAGLKMPCRDQGVGTTTP